MTGEDRLFSFYLAQTTLSRRSDTLLLFDDVEDVFDRGVFMDKPKGWINRQLEVNPVTTLWVCNSIYSIDSAHIRRFDMVVQMDSPPLEIRRKIFGAQVTGLGIEKSWVDRIASHEGLSPGILSQAVQIVSLSDRQNKEETEKDMEMVLQGTLQAMNHINLPRRNASDVIGFQQECLNTDADLSQLIAGLKRVPSARICLYGPPGTGKSAFGRSLASRLGKQLILKRSSDLLGPFVGQTEGCISAMFRDSEKQNAILLLDEADSFLRDRKTAQQSWEVTQVNELLTQMESFDGIFICCTNLIDDLDAASLRRFDLKIYFSPLNFKQSFQLFCQVLKEQEFQATLEPEWKTRLSTLIDLTPGDFAVAVRQQRLRTDDLNPQRLFDALQIECKFRHGEHSKRGIGFCAVF